MSVQRYGCEGETSRNCLHHARAAASKPYQPPDFLPTCGDPTPRVAFLSVTWVRCAHFLEEIARHKLFRPISLRNRPPQTFSAHFLEESAATKLFRLISSGNRPPQNFFGSFPQEIGRHKTFRLISSGNRPPQNFFGSFPQEIAGMGFHSFPQEITGWASTHFLRKS